MSGQSDNGAPSLMARRYLWLLSELHAGNEFSKDQLWRWLEEAESILRRDEASRTPGAI
jgi:hypothetical protein